MSLRNRIIIHIPIIIAKMAPTSVGPNVIEIVPYGSAETKTIKSIKIRPTLQQRNRLLSKCRQKDARGAKEGLCPCCGKNKVGYTPKLKHKYSSRLSHIRPFSKTNESVNSYSNIIITCSECDMAMKDTDLRIWVSVNFPGRKFNGDRPCLY